MKVVTLKGKFDINQRADLMMFAYQNKFSVSISGSTDIHVVAVVPGDLEEQFLEIVSGTQVGEFDVVATI